MVATRYLGQVHGFWRHADVFAAAEPLTVQVAGFLRRCIAVTGRIAPCACTSAPTMPASTSRTT